MQQKKREGQKKKEISYLQVRSEPKNPELGWPLRVFGSRGPPWPLPSQPACSSGPELTCRRQNQTQPCRQPRTSICEHTAKNDLLCSYSYSCALLGHIPP